MSGPQGADLPRRLLDAARAILLEDGYARLSMRRVAAATGCTATAIYHHYENKDALVHALIAEGMERLRQQLEAALADGGETPASRLEALCRAYVAFGLDDREYYEIMFLLHPRELARYPADSYRRARENLELFAGVTAQAGGPTERSARLSLATSLWAALHGVVALVHAGRVDRAVGVTRLVDDAVALAHARLASLPGPPPSQHIPSEGHP